MSANVTLNKLEQFILCREAGRNFKGIGIVFDAFRDVQTSFR